MKTRSVLLFVGWVLWFCGSDLHGQEKKEPSHRQLLMAPDTSAQQKSASLPKIDLPEFLITGNETIDLPNAAKNPAEGGWMDNSVLRNPDPGTREGSSVRLGGMQGKINHPGLGGGFSGKVQAGYSSYRTPSFEGWFGSSISPVDFILKTGYRSSGGHVPDAAYRRGHASLAAGTYLGEDHSVFSGNRVQAEIGMEGNGYGLYGSNTPTVIRTITSFDAGVSTSASNMGMLPYAVRVSLQSTSLRDLSRTAEISAGAGLSATKDIGEVGLKGDLALWRSFYTAPGPNVDPYFTQFAFSAAYRLENSVDVYAGFAFYLFRGTDTKTLGRLYPRLGVSWYADDWVTLFVRFEPSVQRTSLRELATSNPYLASGPALRPKEQFIDFALGAETQISRAIRSRLSLQYTQANYTPVFVDPSVSHMWDIFYGGTTRVITVQGEAYAEITADDNLAASFSIRSNRNSSTGSRNPYFPLFLSSATYEHRFPFGLTFGSTLQGVGRQSTNQTDSNHLPSFVVLSLTAEYMIMPRWSATILLGNLFDQKQTWWENYPGVERTLTFGTSLSW